MSWHARLDLHYRAGGAAPDAAPRTVAHFRHEGPLRVLRSLYPEEGGICHTVLVHPPGGIVGGDRLDITVAVDAGTHAVLTTPGAARFYRTAGAPAVQDTRIRLARDARLEWLPMETLCFSGCRAANHLHLDLEAGAEAIAWDITALGLPQAGQAFAAGSVEQRMELAGAWLEHGVIDAADTRLLDGPLGLHRNRCLATLVLAAGTPVDRARTEQALSLARACIEAGSLATMAGATAVDPRVVVVRALAPMVEPAMALLREVRNAWRQGLWGLAPHAPRTWAL